MRDTNEIERAFRLLDLPLTAAEDAIHRAYRRLSKAVHPDTQGGDADRFKLLTDAKKTALAYAKISHAVIPADASLVSTWVRQAIIAHAGPSAAERARSLNRRSCSKLNRIKWLSWGVAALTGALALAREATAFGPLDQETSQALDQILFPASILAGSIGLLLQSLVSLNRQRIESFLDRISDKTVCAAELSKALRFQDRALIESADLSHDRSQRGPSKWASRVWLIDLDQVRSILISKSAELGLLIPDETGEITPTTVLRYRLTFRPSAFRPVETSPDDQAHGPHERLGELGSPLFALTALLLVVLASGGAYLLWANGSRWAQVTAGFLVFLAVGWAGLAISSLVEIIKRYKRVDL